MNFLTPLAYDLTVFNARVFLKNAGHAINMNQRRIAPNLIDGQTANHTPIERIILSIDHQTKPLKV